jgi:23S rRNA (pseudouridine1915-N3)-methyltransferase
MLDIAIISVGKIKEDYWLEAMAEYKKRLKPYARLQLIEVPEEKVSSTADKKRIMAREAEKIEAIIPVNSCLIALDIAGEENSSVDLAERLVNWSKFATKLVFIIGGPLGLDENLSKKIQTHLSLSRLTFTHQMTRVILLEQIYRAVTIQQGISYHY